MATARPVFDLGFYWLRCSDGWAVIEVYESSGAFYQMGTDKEGRLSQMRGCHVYGPIAEPAALIWLDKADDD